MEQNQNMVVTKGDADTAIDVKGLASLIEDARSQYDLFMRPKRCIFKTPNALLEHNKKAYIPFAFSIGPFHHDNSYLKVTEKIKAKYLEGFLKRSKTELEEVINSINNLESVARECYAGPIGCCREEFVKILVLDGCFIIELLWRNLKATEYRTENDPIFGMSSMVEALGHDLILLENQVPWMVLEHLFSLIRDPESNIALSELAVAFFGDIFPFIPAFRFSHLGDIQHIIDLFRKLFISSIEVGKEKMLVTEWELIPSATRLVEAGIKFRKSTSKNMFDINFRNGVLEIPQILIHEGTEIFFRNLISFEQCYPNDDGMITSYAILLDNLINTEKDVEILSEKKILRNWLNPEDAVKLFNKLYLDTNVMTYYYGNLCKQVNEYCDKRWHRWRAVLVHNYFNTPWAGLSTSAAIILLILTLLQTIYGIKN